LPESGEVRSYTVILLRCMNLLVALFDRLGLAARAPGYRVTFTLPNSASTGKVDQFHAGRSSLPAASTLRDPLPSRVASRGHEPTLDHSWQKHPLVAL
jgi:hypothetical protein